MHKHIFRLFIGIAVTGLFAYTAQAETAQDYTSEQYLNNHGHSKEITRLVTVQKNRTENKSTPTVRFSKIKNFLKNNIYHTDLTRSVNDFGSEEIK